MGERNRHEAGWPLSLVCLCEQVVIGPVNQAYCRGAQVDALVVATGSAKSPHDLDGGSRTVSRLLPWFAEPAIKELGGQTLSTLKSKSN